MNQCNMGFFDLWQRICRSFSVASQQYFSFSRFLKLKPAIIAIALTVTACSGGGGGGGDGGAVDSSGSGASSSNFIVSGTVSAPDGAVVFLPRKNLLEQFADAFIAPVHAAISGFLSVADGSTVQLVRIRNDGTVVSVLATTTTSGGRYSFDLTALGISAASDLVVQVLDSSNTPKMRAFVAGSNVDINPVSETTARIVLVLAAASALDNFTTQELADIYSALYLFVMTKALPSGADIESTVSAFKDAVLADSNIAEFINATAGVGQTAQGPGDIGNYFPFNPNTTWVYQGTEQSDGTTVNYTSTSQITGTLFINGKTTTVFRDTNVGNSHITDDEYLAKESHGIIDYGNTDWSDFLTPQLAPYREYKFPLGLNGPFQSVNSSGLIWPDEDFDGKPETANVKVTVSFAGLEAVTVPAGEFINAAKIITDIIFTVIFSGDGSVATINLNGTEWFASGAGLVKTSSIVKTTAGNTTDTTTNTEELITITREISLATNDLAYDPVSKKLFASVPSSAGSVANSITTIDPESATLGPSVFVGSEPNKMAISDDGQYLYVGLDGASAVRRYNILTQSAGLQFSLGSDPVFGALNVGDIGVLPGSPGSVVIGRKKGWASSYAGVAVYDDGVMRPSLTPFSSSNVIELSTSPARIYSYDNETSGFGISRIDIDAQGASVIDTTANLISGYYINIKYDGGLIYATNGAVVDPEAKIVVDTFPLPSPFSNLVRPDSASGRVYFLSPNLSGSVTIRAFNQKSFLLAGSIDIEDVKVEPPPAPSFMAGSLVRWGDKGLAFRTNENKVIIFRTSLIP